MRAIGLLIASACAKGAWIPPPPPEELEGVRTPELVAFSPDDDLMPVLSPDGRYLLYAGEQNGNLDVWVRDFGTNSTYPLTLGSPTDDWDPEISSDGKSIAFASRRADAKGDIFLASGFSSQDDPDRLTVGTTADRQPRFSPDGKRIYFTSSLGVGQEHVTAIDLETREVKRISPTPGFDPAVSEDGRYIVYTAPAGEARRGSPHLVALRLSDSATRAITTSDAPEGFARFAPAERGQRVVYVRFVDDDNGDGARDPADRSSLWRIDVDLDELFRGSAAGDPFPLTDGSDDEIFPFVAGGALYFTQGADQQDIARLPLGGMFPAYAEPEAYFELARTFEEPRKRWFAFRCAHAISAKGSLDRARSLLRMGNLHLEEARLDLASLAYSELEASTEDAEEGSPRAELRGLALVELVGIDRIRQLARASTPIRREGVLVDVHGRLDEIAEAHASERRVAARVDLEMAEVLVDRGERTKAIAAFDRIVDVYSGESFSAARAMLRRVELLGVAHDPDALAEAYTAIVAAHPDQQDIVREAARKIVALRLGDLSSLTPVAALERADELRRWIPRQPRSAIGVEARKTLADLERRAGALDDAALELAELAVEARAASDRLSEARALRGLAEVEEARGKLDAAGDAWRALRAGFADLPGVGSSARDAITRVNLARAAEEERRGDLDAARRSYQAVIENDVGQIEAHRRYLAVSARTGHGAEAIERARALVASSPGTPIANYVYGLALTWDDPPRLEEAKEAIDRAIELNPLLVHAYITRGWIAEMMQRREKDFWDDLETFLTKAINSVIGQLLDIAISSAGLLEEAIESYETALRLNQESLHPETEVEILINLGNAHYGLGDVAKDIGNFKIAFDLYLDAFRLGARIDVPAREVVFYERFGRSAAWAEEWAIAAMATRRAIHVAREHGIDRLSQLYGNLALIYQQAGEEAYARDALAAFEERLQVAEELDRLVIARRERARARLGTVEEWGPRSFDRILDDLGSARRDLARAGSIERALPDKLLGVTEDVSSAAFGFSGEAELDLNLALAERVHALRGDRGRARALRRSRITVTADGIEAIPSGLLGRQWPLTLLAARERIGLMVAEARDRYAAGDREGGAERIGLVLTEIDRYLEDDDLALDRPSIAIERAKVIAFAAERDPRFVAGIEPALGALDAMLASTGTAAARVGLALTSSSAVAETSSIAGTPPSIAGRARAALAARSRLLFAKGTAARAEAFAEPGGSDIAALLAHLDSSRARLLGARQAFADAASAGAASGPGLGARVVAASLAEVGAIDHELGAPDGLVRALFEGAAATAESNGDLGLAIAIRVRRSMIEGRHEEAEKLLYQVPPSVMEGYAELAGEAFAQTASRALAKGDLEGAITALDRSLVYRRAIGPPFEYDNLREPAEGAIALDLMRNLDELVSARRALARVRGDAPGEVAAAKRRLEVAVRVVKASATSADGVSSEMAMRLFGRPLDATLLQYGLGPDEVLVLAAPIHGLVHLFAIDGSTTTDDKYAHVRTGASLEEARRIVASGDADRIRSLLFAPLEARTRDKRTILLAAADLGPPIPQRASARGLAGPAIAHLSAPTVLDLARGAQLVGADGTLVIAAAGEPPLTEGPRIEGSAVAAFRVGSAPAVLEPGQSRRLEDRTPVERLEQRPVDALVVEAGVVLEPIVPERGVISTEARRPEGSSEADAYRSELPLGALSIPARTLFLASVSDPTIAHATGLDVALAPRGVGTVIVIPGSLPAAARRALIAAVIEASAEHTTAEALRIAIETLAPAHPSIDRALLIGAPGLDAAGRRKFAKEQLKAASRLALDRFKERRHEEAVKALERWIMLQKASGDDAQMKVANDALVGILADHVRPPRVERAADHQRAFVRYLEKRASEREKPEQQKKTEQSLLEARLTLGRLYSDAQDFDQARATFDAVIAELEAKGDLDGLGHALYELAMHEKKTLDDEAAAALMERSIEVYTKAGAYERKARPPVAEAAVSRVAEIYLTRLSDPERAKRAFLRALSLARTEDGRINIELGLARSARRSGDFEDAERYARSARTHATDRGLAQLALSALIEAANVAWYRGDYRKAAELCTQSLGDAGSILARLRSTHDPKVEQSLATQKKGATRLAIYARSVCGLTAMSQGDFAGAIDHLERARGLAGSIGDEREVSAQYNNIGRVLLERGDPGRAIEAFRSAERIDRRLDDRYALAYDLRNLGGALARVGKAGEAKAALETALRFSEEVKDKNNELRARFVLGQLLFDAGDLAAARVQYTAALDLAERLDVRELAWQIHHALGAMHERSAARPAAEAAYRKAIEIAGRMTGRASASEGGANRFTAFGDLISLLLDESRIEDAFAVAERARILELEEIGVRPASAPRAVFDAARLEDLSKDAPEGAVILVVRPLADEVVTFAIDRRGAKAFRTPVADRALSELVSEHGRQLTARADVTVSSSALAEILIRPIVGALEGKQRAALVLSGPIRYVPFAALPLGDGAVIDRMALVLALAPSTAIGALSSPLVEIGRRPIVALGAAPPAPGAADPPLPFAEKEIELIREEYPQASVVRGEGVTVATFADALRGADGVFHFAGHSLLSGESGERFVDPLGGRLRVADGDVTMSDIIAVPMKADLVVLSACQTSIGSDGRSGSGDEIRSLAQAFRFGGADWILATTMHVHDMAASLVVKHFYRASRDQDVVEGLRRAQLEVRRRYPHPAWWATFVLMH
jgi:CHAT domain-containing protein/Tfp pilus assembly protein PilF